MHKWEFGNINESAIGMPELPSWLPERRTDAGEWITTFWDYVGTADVVEQKYNWTR